MNHFIFFGGKSIGNQILKRLLDDGLLPKGIVCYRDHLDCQILNEAKELNISVYVIQKFHSEVPEIINFIKGLNPHYFVSVAFQFILPKDILKLVQWPINIHTGAIPKYRGHHPLAAAFLNDEPYQATTVHLMAEEVDAGKILMQDFIEVLNEDDMVSVRSKLTDLSYNLLSVVISQLNAQTLYPKKQIGEVVWAPKRTPEESKISLNQTSRFIHNFIRTLVDPYPNAFGFIGNKRVQFKKSVVSNSPGKVLKRISEFEYIISTADGIIWVETDQQLTEGDIFND